jgi:hypothetical protein
VHVEHRSVCDPHDGLDEVAGRVVTVLDCRNPILRGGDATERVGVLLFGGALQKHRGVTGVGEPDAPS